MLQTVTTTACPDPYPRKKAEPLLHGFWRLKYLSFCLCLCPPPLLVPPTAVHVSGVCGEKQVETRWFSDKDRVTLSLPLLFDLYVQRIPEESCAESRYVNLWGFPPGPASIRSYGGIWLVLPSELGVTWSPCVTLWGRHREMKLQKNFCKQLPAGLTVIGDNQRLLKSECRKTPAEIWHLLSE